MKLFNRIKPYPSSQATYIHKLDTLEAEEKEKRVKSFTPNHLQDGYLLEAIHRQELQLTLPEAPLY